MIKVVFCLHRLPELSLEEFQRYWLETHAPLVRSHADTLRIKRYVQVHSTDTPANAVLQGSRGAPTGYDGVAELWWESLDDIIAATSSDEGRAAAQALLDDEQRFIDLARSPLWLTEEHEIIAP